MKVRGIPNIVILMVIGVVALAACAGPAKQHTVGTWDDLSEVSKTGVMTCDLHGAFEGVLTISRGVGKGRTAIFEGTVAGQSGGFVGSVTALGNRATTPITILSGSGDLEDIRGQLTTYMDSHESESGTYGGWFDIGGS